jgi:hypothetical protein
MARFCMLLVLSLGAWMATALTAAAAAETTIWKPLGPVLAEADTLLLPDLTSIESVEKQGGFALGVWTEKKPVAELYEFGPGRSGPAFRGRNSPWSFYNWACDGIVSGDEFTIEFSFKADKPWGEMSSHRGFFGINGGNTLNVTNEATNLVIEAGHGFLPGGKSLSLELAPWSLDDQRWHALAFTWKNRVLTVWLDGKQAGELTDLPWGALWSDTTHADGIMLGGVPGISKSWFWISDFRISRTARIPGQAVPLRSLAGSLVIDTTTTNGTLPLHLLGGLHPTTTAKPGVVAKGLQVIRTDKLLVATPIKRGGVDAAHPSAGRSGKFSYDWQVCDRSFDWITAQGALAFISLDATPQVLGGSIPPYSGTRLTSEMSFASGFGPNPPDQLADWALVVGDLVHHILIERKETVPWWGVWNEPADSNAFWSAGLKAYLDLYAVTVAAVRAVDPHAQVGGPESASFDDESLIDGKSQLWIKALIERCAADKVPLDFISFHDYAGSLLTPERAQRQIGIWAKEAGLPKVPKMVVGEFNWALENVYRTGKSQFSQGMWHLRSIGAAYTTAYLTRVAALGGIDSLIFAHVSYDDPRAGSAQAIQLIGPKGEVWAPFNALTGWKTVMGGERLATPDQDLPPGVFAAASRDAATARIGVALANYGYVQRSARSVALSLTKLPAGRYTVRRYLVDPTHSSRWDVAEDRPEGVKADSLEKVEERQVVVTADQPLRVELTLPAWSSTFVEVRPARK